MKNAGLFASLAAGLLFLFTVGCASALINTPVPVQSATPLPTASAVPDDLPQTDAPWVQTEVYTTWAEHDTAGITRADTPAAIPDSVMNMLPLVEFLLDYRTAYDFQYNDLQFFETIPTTNQHVLDNEVYLWGLMAHLFYTYGIEHPAAEMSENGAVLRVSEAAARDFLEVCFADYTAEFVLPTEPPNAFLEKPIGYTDTDPAQFMVFQNGTYACDARGTSFLTGSRQRYMITGSVESDNGTYELDIIKLYGPDGYDVAIYHVALSANDAPNALGLLWRVARIVRIDTSDLWAGQTESVG